MKDPLVCLYAFRRSTQSASLVPTAGPPHSFAARHFVVKAAAASLTWESQMTSFSFSGQPAKGVFCKRPLRDELQFFSLASKANPRLTIFGAFGASY